MLRCFFDGEGEQDERLLDYRLPITDYPLPITDYRLPIPKIHYSPMASASVAFVLARSSLSTKTPNGGKHKSSE